MRAEEEGGTQPNDIADGPSVSVVFNGFMIDYYLKREHIY